MIFTYMFCDLTVYVGNASRSSRPLTLGEWHEVRLSRTGRLAVLQIDGRLPDQVLAPGAFLQLSLPLNMFLGGVPSFHAVSPKVRVRTSYVGCIQKVSETFLVYPTRERLSIQNRWA